MSEEMTDKQIIIDDVDISKCEYRSKLLEGVCTFYGRCANTFCPYKAKWLKEQLLRKEQECEKAKQNAQDTYELYKALMESFNILQSEKIKLEQEYEELKAELELFKTSNQTTIDQLKAENEELKQKLNNGSEMSLDCALLAEIDRLTQENEWFKSVAEGGSIIQSQLRDDRRKLRKTLAEIKS